MEGDKISQSAREQDLARRRKRTSCIVLAVAAFVVVVPLVVTGAYLASKKNNAPDPEPVGDESPEPVAEDEDTSGAGTSNKNASKPAASKDNSAAVAAEKEKLLNFFVELANKDDKDETWPGPIARWNKSSVSIGVGEGVFTERQSSCLNAFVADFNSVSSSVKLFRDDTVDLGIPNIKIYYLDEETFATGADPNQQYGYQQGQYNDDMSFKRAAIFLSEKIATVDSTLECQIIRHEATHAIGFWGHSDIYFESIMSLPKTSYSFNTADRKAIEMLYNSGVPLGSYEADTRAYFATRDY